ncbi:MAG: hypothetical protein CXZ00_16725 [Acidobacteria bacterium]|nr:MAG: hypothetical protein CXZ00_16725 [Acidobacteriota bacterium]
MLKLLKQPTGCLGFSESNNATFSPDHAISEESNLSSSTPHRKGTAEIAIREVPTKRRIWLSPEKVLLFHYDRALANLRGNLRVLRVLTLQDVDSKD